MSVVVTPSTREMFTPRELTDAYKDFEKRGPQYLDAETGIKAAAYRFGERVLFVHQKSEVDVAILIHRSAWKVNSRKFGCRILQTHGLTGLETVIRPDPALRSRALHVAVPHKDTLQ
jgi:hypothetical protein